jgi:hypothetical protein
MSDENVFADEWRECLREHYKFVVKENDNVTRQSLTKVLLSDHVRFNEDELQHLYIEATMRAEDQDGDTLPDVNAVASDVAQLQQDGTTFEVHPAECTCALCSPAQAQIDAVLETGHDADGQPLPPDMPAEEIAQEPRGNVFPVAKVASIDEDNNEDDDTTEAGDESIIDDVTVEDADESDDNGDDKPQQISMF